MISLFKLSQKLLLVFISFSLFFLIGCTSEDSMFVKTQDTFSTRTQSNSEMNSNQVSDLSNVPQTEPIMIENTIDEALNQKGEINSSDNDITADLPPGSRVITEEFIQKTKPNEADIVWVIDNSGSMYNKQQQLVDNFGIFLDKFLQKEIKFRMAITSTDPNVTGKTKIIQTLDDWQLQINPDYSAMAASGLFINPIDKLTSEVYFQDSALFKYYFTGKEEDHQNSLCYPACLNKGAILGIDYGFSRLGIYGSTEEMGLLAIIKSLEKANEQNIQGVESNTPESRNKDFFTESDDAFTIFIVISDEDDNSTYRYPNESLGTLNGAPGTYLGDLSEMMQILGRDVSKLRIHSVVNKRGAEYTNLESDTLYGNRYESVSKQTHGKVYPLNEYKDPNNPTLGIKSFGDHLAEMADDLSILLAGFTLRSIPDLNYPIKVRADNREMIENFDWHYDATNNAILFTEGHIPAMNTEIRVTYTIILD